MYIENFSIKQPQMEALISPNKKVMKKKSIFCEQSQQQVTSKGDFEQHRKAVHKVIKYL